MGRRHHPYQHCASLPWTRKFFCFANVGTRTVPMSKGTKEAHAAIGLMGEKVISLPSNGSAKDLHQQILETFPPLASCGGYTLLRCMGKSKSLEIMEPPSGGHTPLSLSAVVGQSRVYVRPLQRDISTPLLLDEKEVSLLQQIAEQQNQNFPTPKPFERWLCVLLLLQDHCNLPHTTISSYPRQSIAGWLSEGRWQQFGLHNCMTT